MGYYDFDYFHQLRLQLLSENYDAYKDVSEKDLLVLAINNGEIEDVEAINWLWISDELYGEEIYVDSYHTRFEINHELEHFIERIVSYDTRIKVLTFLRDNCRKCLFERYFDWESVENFEVECARLISQTTKLIEKAAIPEGSPLLNTEQGAYVQPIKRYTAFESIIIDAVQEYHDRWEIVNLEQILLAAEDFVVYFRDNVKKFEDNRRDEKLKPCMSQQKYLGKIAESIFKHQCAYDKQNRSPIYQVLFVSSILMGMPDHRHSWWETKFAEGTVDYLEKTQLFQGCRPKRQKALNTIMSMSQYKIDFDAVNSDNDTDTQTAEIRLKQEQHEAQRVPKTIEPPQQPTDMKATQNNQFNGPVFNGPVYNGPVYQAPVTNNYYQNDSSPSSVASECHSDNQPNSSTIPPDFFRVSERFSEENIRERLAAELSQATTKKDYCRGLYRLQRIGCINIDQYASDAQRAVVFNRFQSKYDLSASDFCKARMN